MSARPARSWMFVPGNKERYLEKAAHSEVDCVLLDLEDGVLPDAKPAARAMVAAALSGTFLPQRYVRVNAVPTGWHSDDLDAVVVPGLDGICLSKCEGPAEIELLSARLARLEAERGIAVGSVRILAAIESASGLLAAPEIARADPRVVGLMLGAEDFALDLGLGTAREGEAAELIYARSALVVAAGAAHVLSVDGVFPDLDDEEGMERDCLRARRLGFSAKSTFNPRQVAVINRIFSPRPDEIAYAAKVVAAFEEAERRGDASVAVGGQLVDRPIVLRAQRILELAKELELLGTAATGEGAR
jgi:citrate lyase subunit beta/citryl-CoA lyase